MKRVWPAMTDYAAAVQDPGATFRLPALAQASFATMPPFGLPAVASGQNAVVFTADIGSSTMAVRCFTNECEDGRHRYRALHDHLQGNSVPAMASSQWIDDAIELNGQVWPIVTMEWVHGEQLHDYVAASRSDPARLTALSDEWVATCSSLRSAALAHGDLQHGNVIVEQSGSVRLIDFDGVWIRDVASSPPSEVGHPNYQHPSRRSSGVWGWSIDWFSAFAVYVSVRALAADRSLWEFHMGENLIFREEDFWGDAEIWSRLERSPDGDVRSWSQLLAEACAHPADSPYELATILNSGLQAVSAPNVEVQPTATSAPVEKTSAATASSPSVKAASADGEDPPVEAPGRVHWWNDPSADSPPDPTAQTASGAAEFRPASDMGESSNTQDATGPQPKVSESTEAWPFAVGSTQAPTGDGTGAGIEANPASGGSGQAVRPPERERPKNQRVESGWKSGAPTTPGPAATGPAQAPPPGQQSPTGVPGGPPRFRTAPMYNPPGPPPPMYPPNAVTRKRSSRAVFVGYLVIAALIVLIVFAGVMESQ